MRDYLTVTEAAAILGVTPQRVRQLTDEGRIASEAVNARLLLIRRADLDAYQQAPPLKRGPKPKRVKPDSDTV